MQSDIQNLCGNFLKSFYNQYDENRANLGRFFTNQSLLTLEGDHSIGSQNIVEAYSNKIKAQKIKHQVLTYDPHPLSDGSLMILVTGKLLIDSESNALNFSESFVLGKNNATGSYYVHSNIFRINYG